MSLMFAAIAGWCGTKWPGWWKWPTPPEPDPEPWRDLGIGVVGAIGGIATVILVGGQNADLGIMETAVVGLFGGVFLGSIANAFMGGAKRM